MSYSWKQNTPSEQSIVFAQNLLEELSILKDCDVKSANFIAAHERASAAVEQLLELCEIYMPHNWEIAETSK